MYEIAQTGKCNFRFSGNQNLILADISEDNKGAIEELLKKYGLDGHNENNSAVRKNSIACVAFNTCPLALAEAQRYLPTLITKIEPLLEKYELKEEEITLRMTGCPNGCGRSPAAEIGLIGTSYGFYNLHIGGDRNGERLNTKYRDSLDESGILAELDQLFGLYATKRNDGETFGDFVIREKLV